MNATLLKRLALGASLCLVGGFGANAGAATCANVSTVCFSNFLDSDGSALNWDIALNSVSGNTITLGLNNLTASAGPANLIAFANDAISFLVTAPTGYVITSVSYLESGSATTTAGVATATGSMVADNIPVSFPTQVFGPNSGATWTIQPNPIAIANKAQIGVSISDNLFAYSLGGNATISKAPIVQGGNIVRPELSVTIAAVPLPPAVALFGSALIGIVTIGRRRLRGSA